MYKKSKRRKSDCQNTCLADNEQEKNILDCKNDNQRLSEKSKNMRIELEYSPQKIIDTREEENNVEMHIEKMEETRDKQMKDIRKIFQDEIEDIKIANEVSKTLEKSIEDHEVTKKDLEDTKQALEKSRQAIEEFKLLIKKNNKTISMFLKNHNEEIKRLKKDHEIELQKLVEEIPLSSYCRIKEKLKDRDNSRSRSEKSLQDETK